MNRAALLLLSAILAVLAIFPPLAPLTAQSASTNASPAELRDALANARAQQRNARARAERLETETQQAEEASLKARTEAAALAARVQQAEASVAAAQAELAVVERERRDLGRDLAARRAPLAQLAGALQTMARRPLALAALQPGSLKDIVHTRALLGGTIPVVNARTAALRSELDRVRRLEGERIAALETQRNAERSLVQRRRDMLALAEQQRVLAQQAAGGASREAQQALVLAEEARDLDALVGGLAQSAELRQRLASLEGPVVRPGRPQDADVPRSRSTPTRRERFSPPEDYLLPVAGELVAGFGEALDAGGRRTDLAIRPRPGAQVIAPAAGRVGFAGTYEGYGRVAIIEHAGGWTSVVTGLGSISVATGQTLSAGSPLGRASTQDPEISLELRRGGQRLNPLEALR